MLRVIKFGADWCGPCRMLKPVLTEVQLSTGIVIDDINVDEHQAAAAEYGVRSIPVVVIEKDGEEVDRFVGVQTARTYIAAIEKANE